MNEYDLFPIIGNKNRIHILRKLSAQDGKATHSDLSHRLGLNPKVTRDHLRVLIDNGLVEKLEIGYGFTEFGTRFAVILNKLITTFEVFIDYENNLKRESKTDES